MSDKQQQPRRSFVVKLSEAKMEEYDGENVPTLTHPSPTKKEQSVTAAKTNKKREATIPGEKPANPTAANGLLSQEQSTTATNGLECAADGHESQTETAEKPTAPSKRIPNGLLNQEQTTTAKKPTAPSERVAKELPYHVHEDGGVEQEIMVPLGGTIEQVTLHITKVKNCTSFIKPRTKKPKPPIYRKQFDGSTVQDIVIPDKREAIGVVKRVKLHLFPNGNATFHYPTGLDEMHPWPLFKDLIEENEKQNAGVMQQHQSEPATTQHQAVDRNVAFTAGLPDEPPERVPDEPAGKPTTRSKRDAIKYQSEPATTQDQATSTKKAERAVKPAGKPTKQLKHDAIKQNDAVVQLPKHVVCQSGSIEQHIVLPHAIKATLRINKDGTHTLRLRKNDTAGNPEHKVWDDGSTHKVEDDGSTLQDIVLPIESTVAQPHESEVAQLHVFPNGSAKIYRKNGQKQEWGPWTAYMKLKDRLTQNAGVHRQATSMKKPTGILKKATKPSMEPEIYEMVGGKRVAVSEPTALRVKKAVGRSVAFTGLPDRAIKRASQTVTGGTNKKARTEGMPKKRVSGLRAELRDLGNPPLEEKWLDGRKDHKKERRAPTDRNEVVNPPMMQEKRPYGRNRNQVMRGISTSKHKPEHPIPYDSSYDSTHDDRAARLQAEARELGNPPSPEKWPDGRKDHKKGRHAPRNRNQVMRGIRTSKHKPEHLIPYDSSYDSSHDEDDKNESGKEMEVDGPMTEEADAVVQRVYDSLPGTVAEAKLVWSPAVQQLAEVQNWNDTYEEGVYYDDDGNEFHHWADKHKEGVYYDVHENELPEGVVDVPNPNTQNIASMAGSTHANKRKSPPRRASMHGRTETLVTLADHKEDNDDVSKVGCAPMDEEDEEEDEEEKQLAAAAGSHVAIEDNSGPGLSNINVLPSVQAMLDYTAGTKLTAAEQAEATARVLEGAIVDEVSSRRTEECEDESEDESGTGIMRLRGGGGKWDESVCEAIKELQKSTQPLTALTAWEELAKEYSGVIYNSYRRGKGNYRWQHLAFHVLREGCEAVLIDVFRDAYAVAKHARRQTLMIKDIHLLSKLQSTTDLDRGMLGPRKPPEADDASAEKNSQD